MVPALKGHGIELVRWEDLSADELAHMERVFDDQIFPVLTPLAVDPAHPFPYISGLSLNLAVVVRNPATGGEHFARVKAPQILPRFYPVSPQRFVPLEDVISEHLDRLFPGMEVLQHHSFRVTRNEDVEVEEDEAENLMKAMERELMRRRFGPPVRLEVEETIDPHVLDLLVRELGVEADEVIALPSPLDLTGLWGVHAIDRVDLKDRPFLGRVAAEISEVETADAPDIFEAVRDHDVLLHHPYDSFSTSVQAFLEQAAADPQVLAIKQTLYRTSGDSPIVDALIDAAESGKQVLVLVELKARFDEQANIKRARKLEQAGCHVVYGVVGLKTHCKLSLVVRREVDGIRRYTHMGTGNYHPATARLYEDLGLITADPQVGADAANLFNVLTGYSLNTSYERLLVAPHSVRSGLLERIERETAHARAGRPARIRFKANAIVDEQIIDGLYRASQAGVRGRHLGARDLRPARRRPRAVREHHGAQHPGPLPGAQPDLLVRQRRRPGGLDRQRRHDAPQPRPTGGVPGAALPAGARAGARRAARPRLRRQHVLLAAGRAGHLAARDDRSRRRPAPRPARAPDRPRAGPPNGGVTARHGTTGRKRG